MELAEILAALNAHDDVDAAVKAMTADNGAIVRAFRSQMFGSGKKEGEKEHAKAVKAVQDELAAAKATLAEKDTEIEGLKAKTPDKDAIEAPLKKKIEKLEAAAAETATATQQRIRGLLRERDLGGFSQLLAGASAEAAKLGIARQLDPDYVAVVAARMEAEGRFRYNDKDELEVLDADGVPFPVTDPKAPRYAALAAELNKAAPDKWARTPAAGGAGVGGQGGGSGYDPVAAGKAAAEAQKGSAEDNKLAFM